MSYQHDAAHAQQRSYAIHAAESFSSQPTLQPALYPLNRKFRVSAMVTDCCDWSLKNKLDRRSDSPRASSSIWACLSRVYFSRYPPNGELARRLPPGAPGELARQPPTFPTPAGTNNVSLMLTPGRTLYEVVFGPLVAVPSLQRRSFLLGRGSEAFDR